MQIYGAVCACLRLFAFLVVVVVVLAVGDQAACPSLLLQSGSCIMTPVRYTLFHSGMRSLCFGECVCVRAHIYTHTHAYIRRVQERVFAEKLWSHGRTQWLCLCVCVGIGKSIDLGGWVQEVSSNVNSEGVSRRAMSE